MNVKTYSWFIMGDTDTSMPKLVVERQEPHNESTVVVIQDMNSNAERVLPKVLIEKVQDFQVKGNFMFATKKADQVYINLFYTYFLYVCFFFLISTYLKGQATVAWPQCAWWQSFVKEVEKILSVRKLSANLVMEKVLWHIGGEN